MYWYPLECYACDRVGVYVNRGTSYKLCPRCNATYFKNKHKFNTIQERFVGISESNRKRHAKNKIRICYCCGVKTYKNTRGEETWCYNYDIISGLMFSALCYECYGWLYAGRNPTIVIHQSKETINKKRQKILGVPKYNYRNEKHKNWHGGITILKTRISNLSKYKTWRLAVFTKDKFACVICGQVTRDVQAHHKKSFSKIVRENKILTIEDAEACDELWDVNNGETLCKEHHKHTFTYLNGKWV